MHELNPLILYRKQAELHDYEVQPVFSINSFI